jgi:hypothetical protein
MLVDAGAPPRCGEPDETEIDMKMDAPSGRGNAFRVTAWLAAWWQRRRLRIAMRHIAEFSPEFRRDLGLADATIDDLIAAEGDDDCAAARRAILGERSPAPRGCAPATNA